MSLYEEFLNKKNEKKSAEKDTGSLPDSIDTKKEEEQRKEFLKIIEGKQDEKTDQELKQDFLSPDDKDETSKLPPVPSAPLKGHKLWARILAVCLIIAAASSLSAFLWYWLIKTPKIVTEIITEEKEVIKIVPETEPSLSFFNYDQFLDTLVSRKREIPVYLKQYLTDDHQHNHLIKISIRDHTDPLEPEFVTLTSFFESLGVNPPRDMYEKVEHYDFNIFIYSGDRNDIGFAFPVKDDSMTELLGIILANWDETIERDFFGFYSLVDPRGGEMAIPSTIYRRANIRCRGFRSAHHACFAPLDNVFIITTSLESAKATIDRNR